MGARQDADFGHDRTDRLGVAAVDALASVEHGVAHHVGLEIAELLAEGRQLGILAFEQFLGLGFHGADVGLPHLLLGLGVGRGELAAYFGLELGGHGLRSFRRIGERQRLLGAMLGELDDGVDHRLEGTMALHDGAQHHVLGQFLGLGLDHQHAFLGAGDHEVEGTGGDLVAGRIDDELAVEVADAGGADRAHERHAADGKGGRRSDHGDDVGIVLEVVREHGDDDQRLVAIGLVEQRPDRTIDQARGQHFLLARPAFTLEEAARDLAGGEGLLLVVHGQREEVEAGFRLLLEYDGGQHRGAAVGGHHRTVGLARDLAGFEHELAPRPVQFLAKYLKHLIHPFHHGRPPPFGDNRPLTPLRQQDRVRPLLSPLPSRLPRCRVSRPNSRGPDDATRKGPVPGTGPVTYRRRPRRSINES